MTRTFEVTVPKIDIPWSGGAAIADAMRSRVNEAIKSRTHDRESTSKLPAMLVVACLLIALVVLFMAVKSRKSHSVSSAYVGATDSAPTSVETDSEDR